MISAEATHRWTAPRGHDYARTVPDESPRTYKRGVSKQYLDAAYGCDDHCVEDIARTAACFVAVGFVEDGDGTGELQVYAQSGGFAGHGAAYFDAMNLAEFGGSLDGFPLPHGLVLAGGFWSREAPHELEQELVGLRFHAVGGRGQVGIGVHLAGERSPGTRPESVHEVRLELLTTYERLRTFSRDFVAVARGQLDRAEIHEEILI